MPIWLLYVLGHAIMWAFLECACLAPQLTYSVFTVVGPCVLGYIAVWAFLERVFLVSMCKQWRDIVFSQIEYEFQSMELSEFLEDLGPYPYSHEELLKCVHDCRNSKGEMIYRTFYDRYREEHCLQ